MLSALRSIVQEVNNARSLQAALDIIVRRIRAEMKTDVCSIYLRNEQDNYVLMATEGLNVGSVGIVQLGLGQGLVGWVAAREEPINLKDAGAHPRYQYFPETGEERYNSFLGVPIIHQRQVLGVLVVQQVHARRFDEGEEAFLITISAQLASVIAHAEATGALKQIGQLASEAKFTGVGGAPGIAIGKAVVLQAAADLRSVPFKKCQNVDDELALFHAALASARNDIKKVGEQLKERLSKEELALFDAYLSMLDDASLGGEVIERIRQGLTAPYAWSQVILEHENNFSSMEDAYLRERATDVRDLGRRVLAYLQVSSNQELVFPDKTILIGEELTASTLGEVPEDKLVGLVSVQGSSNSHVAILARAMGIPTVMGAVDLPYTQLDQRELIVDGHLGLVYSDPGDELRRHYEEVFEEERLIVKGLEALKDLPCETLDNHRVPLWVNTGLMIDAMRSLERGAEGVGLYRTEVPFLMRDRFPSEEEQRQIYREQLQAFAPNPVTMRTLDVGGDKALPYFPIEEANPFLGWRGIRVTLDHPEIFLGQIRAMLKASEGLDNLRIMLPMISNVQELETAQGLIYRAYHELLEEGFDITLPPIGVMVEVPSAVYLTRELAARVDYISVGSNDLTQYLLAVDRNNARVAHLYESLHPAVLRALHYVVVEAHTQGTPVGICGELAGDPGAAILLMAMGFDVLSMNAASLLKVKSVIRSITLDQADILLKQVMSLPDAASIHQCVRRVLTQAGINRFFQPSHSDASAN